MHVLLKTVFIVCVARSCVGFLLDASSNKTMQSKYVTQSEFLDKNSVLHRETENLRHDMDKTFETLTTQLKQRLDAIESQVNDHEQINATKLDDLERKYQALSVKYKILQNENTVCSQKLNNLSLKANAELNSIKQHAADYERNQTFVVRDLQQMITDLNNDTRSIESSVSMLTSQVNANAEQVVRWTFGFLLDGPSNTTQNVPKSQYVTRNEFLNKNRVLHQDTADLRHDMDQTFEMLTTQLKQRLDAFEKQVKSLVQINATELDDLKTEYEALSKKYATLQNHTDAIQKENAALKQELSILKNTTDQFATELSELKSLKGIQTLQEVTQIKQDLKTSSDKIHELQSREQARSQDFVALYKMSLNTNAELKSVKEHIESNVSLLSGRIEVNAEQVALLAYATVTKATGPIKFNNVGFSVGIRNLTSFETDGKFTCEIPGLYLVSVSISTYETYSNLIMYKNGVAIASSEISHGSNRRYASGTATVVTALMEDDTVWVECNYEILLGHYPHLSIVKIK